MAPPPFPFFSNSKKSPEKATDASGSLDMNNSISRRRFLKTTAGATVGVILVMQTGSQARATLTTSSVSSEKPKKWLIKINSATLTGADGKATPGSPFLAITNSPWIGKTLPEVKGVIDPNLVVPNPVLNVGDTIRIVRIVTTTMLSPNPSVTLEKPTQAAQIVVKVDYRVDKAYRDANNAIVDWLPMWSIDGDINKDTYPNVLEKATFDLSYTINSSGVVGETIKGVGADQGEDNTVTCHSSKVTYLKTKGLEETPTPNITVEGINDYFQSFYPTTSGIIPGTTSANGAPNLVRRGTS